MSLSGLPAIDLEVALQLGLAIVLGALIGIEREVRGRAAGLRTMIIVCLGSTLIMIVSAWLVDPISQAERDIIRVDPGRVASGIVTGVGFLGAGVVLKMGDLVRGVTTAACIWFVAGVGIAIGQRHYSLATAATLACILTLWLLRYIDRFLPTRIYRCISITAIGAGDLDESARTILSKLNLRLMDVKASFNTESKRWHLTYFVSSRQRFQAQDVVQELSAIGGIESVKWT